MGLLRLGSIYKKSRKETAPAAVPPVPIVDPPSLLKLNLNIEEKQQSKKDLPTASATGTLFDDILTELKSKPDTEQDNINNDFQLALALSEQLSLEQPSTKKITVPEKSENTNNSFLFGTDSIYSSYLRNMSAIETTTTDSMFDSLMNSKSDSSNTTTYQETVSIAQPNTAVNKVVLDSDISDSDEESVHSVESIDKEKRGKKDGKRMTKGPQPILERRGPNLNIQRKVDHRTDAEINESVIQRMKDRHRTQAKLTALRQQQQQEEEYNNNMYNMVPQSYGFPTMVLPQPGFIMDPYYAPPQEMHHLPNPHYIPNQQLPPMSVPAGFMPNPKHISIAATFKKEDQHEEAPRMSIQPTKSISTPTQRSNQRYSSRPGFDPSPITSSSTLESIQEHEPMQVPQIRSSRSTPNLKKKNNKKVSTKPKTRAPPRLRHMKSEPELIERNHHHRYNQQQLNNEWERMQQNPYNYQQQPVVYYNNYPYH